MILGKESKFPKAYNPDIIDVIPRHQARENINYDPKLFSGLDLWTIYEFSHISENNIPSNAILSLSIPQQSQSIPESKSLKLYFNSVNHLKKAFNECLLSVGEDISKSLSCNIVAKKVKKVRNTFLTYLDEYFINLDSSEKIDLTLRSWTKSECKKTETQYYFSSLFRSNCPVTNQPDWASLFIAIDSKYKVDESELLSYIVSFRNHQAFHEQCVEEIIVHLQKELECKNITVYARFTRRGGIDINPYRFYGKEDIVFKEIINESKKLSFWDPRQ